MTDLTLTAPSTITAVAQAANHAAANHVFDDYKQRKAANTIKNQFGGLLRWCEYLMQVGAGADLMRGAMEWSYGLPPEQTAVIAQYAANNGIKPGTVCAAHYCQHTAAAWRGITWGLVEGFVKWLLNEGYSLGSVNNRLSAVRIYVRLALKAGVIPPDEYALIAEVRGYGRTEGKRVDMKRPLARIGHKKAESIVLTTAQARLLKESHPPTPQGIRDRLMVCLLLDLGLRASELSQLRMDDISGVIVTVYRQKTDTTNKMELSAACAVSLEAYRSHFANCSPSTGSGAGGNGRLLRGSKKNGQLTDTGMSVRAIEARVRLLGQNILGIWGLSPHDLRHTWATNAAKNSSPFVLRDAGGWTNMNTPGRYVETAVIVNDGIKLEY